MPSDPTLAILDVETTGLFAGYNHRVIEIAVVRQRVDGTVLDEYVTLVNPERDVGATRVHGIRAADVVNAPLFRDIAGDVVDRLNECVIVGHNVRFDLGFLVAELDRLDTADVEPLRICTLHAATRLLPIASRKLDECCAHYGIDLDQSHSAISDARATGRLCARLTEAARQNGYAEIEQAIKAAPSPPINGKHLSRSGRVHRRDVPQLESSPCEFLARLVGRLAMAPVQQAEPAALSAYLDLLDRALEDRVISAGEAEALDGTASAWGLSGNDIVAAHHNYVQGLAAAALADNVLTDDERQDLVMVAGLLGISRTVLETILADAALSRQAVKREPAAESFAGKSVCFTGESICGRTRSECETLATRAGLVVKKSVTKGLDLLVVADPHTQSGKAKKARDYGTRIIAEPVFWERLGVA